MSAPSDIPTGRAFVAANGELAWHRRDIGPAVSRIRDAGQAILGGEVWLIIGQDTWDGLIPQRAGGPPVIYSWETPPRSLSESWRDYCHRTAAESIHVIGLMTVESDISPDLADKLRFNITYIAEPTT
jgi:hypothetical protein